MASGVTQKFNGSVLGAAADVSIETCPFRPKIIRLYVNNGGFVQGYKSDEMSGSNYLSTVGADTGLTINDDGFTLANGADVNVAGASIYFDIDG